MTLDEAIKTLSDMGFYWDWQKKAINTAIKSLEMWRKIQEEIKKEGCFSWTILHRIENYLSEVGNDT